MFCSKCGQEQAPESLRFCARCGFKLNTDGDRLAQSLIKMAMYLVLTICAIFGWGSFTAGPAYMQVRMIIALIAAVTFYLLFARDLKRLFGKSLFQNNEEMKQVTPDSESVPVPALGSYRVNTAELVQPPSVTEHTTILLDKNKH